MVSERKRQEVKKILFITLSNIGDVILTLPSLDYLKHRFKDASFTILSGPYASRLFSGDPRIKENISYDKHMLFRKKLTFFNRLRKENFDVIIDLRDTAFRWFAQAKFKNPCIINVPKDIRHLRLSHLYKTKKAFNDTTRVEDIRIPPASIYIDRKAEDSANNLLKQYSLSLNAEYIVVSPGARSRTKRWQKEGFIQVCRELLKNCCVILIGDKDDGAITQEINRELDNRCIDLAGKTDLSEVMAILKSAKLVICNDSGILHIASYFNKPTLAIFGPTDENKFGPWSEISAVVRKNTICSPCQKDNCTNGYRCLRNISPQLAVDYAHALIEGKIPAPPVNYRRILITRTDRLGDVLLSTPVIKNLRDNLPGAYIAMMIKSSLEDLLKGNPYLDEVILFDKRGRHAGIVNSFRFAGELNKKNFDLALILHPRIRVHIILFLARIKERIGYDIKFGFLNTRILKHTKHLGEKHESEYTLDFLRELGIDKFDKTMFMPVYKEAEEWAVSFLKERRLSDNKVVLIHAQASCPSRLWPDDYYNRLIEDIIDIHKAKIIYVGDLRDEGIKESENIINMTKKTSIAQLASLIKHSDLLISNDSGPVHIAVALGTPVISIFGRNQPGLSPRRWAHSNAKSVFLHKSVGCEVCFAHDCNKGFACLKAIQPQEVFAYADKFLSGS
ncbi:MAG: glycosyltransferase family 9 protein [Candidatus Omnitrophica bacterium]|nr:glycosyltransferase family 9 protein [Candidatus Omnitrophota bacterium]MDD5351837.1 glycosyltransferase family 9 protein [Candidatus Omnitrophota bacterium]MDD5550663.1 glycosyltransferase family 9 protein [Candidatus Omnitrophota bacterium]